MHHIKNCSVLHVLTAWSLHEVKDPSSSLDNGKWWYVGGDGTTFLSWLKAWKCGGGVLWWSDPGMEEVGYKWPPEVASNTWSTEQFSMWCSRCKTCPILLTTKNSTSHSIGNIPSKPQPHANHQMSYKYLTRCKCGLRCVKETGQALHCRTNNHWVDITHRRTHEKPVAQHLASSGHSLDDMEVHRRRNKKMGGGGKFCVPSTCSMLVCNVTYGHWHRSWAICTKLRIDMCTQLRMYMSMCTQLQSRSRTQVLQSRVNRRIYSCCVK